MAAVRKLAASQAAALLVEYDALKKKGKIRRETECIHSHGSGSWGRFETNAVHKDISAADS